MAKDRRIKQRNQTKANRPPRGGRRASTSVKEKRFYDSLRDIFVGAEVEGESGYINLMAIKSRYYEDGVFPKLKQDTEKALEQFPEFREELFDKLYTFFHRYFSESGSIYFSFTPLHQNVYEKVYTDDKDVMLFWKTHMLYYVKTDRLFRNLEAELDGFKFFFDVSTLEHKRAMEKREIVHEFKTKRKDGTLVFNVSYSERGRKTRMDKILRECRKQGVAVSEDTLERAFRVFAKQSEVDYFINKDAKAFLREQFNLWLYQYVFSGESEWRETRIKQLQALKDIAFKIIDFISQFEDELVRIWNKPKFVLNSNYVITLDRTAERDMGLVERLLRHEGFKSQVEEWRQLGIVGDSFRKEDVVESNLMGKQLNDKYRHLPIDTRYFKDFELEILGLFENLDEALDGWLIKSENYQAMNTLLSKFGNKIKSIYIDPPYNSDTTEIHYVNKYKHSSWLTLLENRLSIAKEYLKDDGILCIAIDDNEYHRLIHVVSKHFPENLGVAVVRSNPAGRSTPKGFSLNHEYAVFCAKTANASAGRLERSSKQKARYKEEDERGRFEWVNFRKHGGLREEARSMFYPIYATSSGLSRIPKMTWDKEKKEWIALEQPREGEEVLLPIDEQGQERRWKWTSERFRENKQEAKVDSDRHGQLAIYIKSRMPEEGVTPHTWWDKKEYSATDHGTRTLKDLFGEHGLFSYPKSVDLVKDCLRAAALDPSCIALDFFAGSGTTGHAVINFNRDDGEHRKYILVEMADYFDTVLLPRIKKVVFSDEWKAGKAQNGQGCSHFFKYYQLEQYEDTLRKAKYEGADLFEDPYRDPYNQYVFLRDLKMLEALEVDLEQGEVKVDLSKLYDNIDIAETLSNLRGKWIKKITPDFVEFEDGEKVDFKNLDYRLIKPLIWW